MLFNCNVNTNSYVNETFIGLFQFNYTNYILLYV